ncbi:MAG: SRPBCC domain-containing protein [Planctomycetia bacterium]|nr:SRPBCC domain-containing protein [Planctomycetia bacterium]
MTPPTYALRIEREFDAPRDVVYRAWTDPAERRQWFHFNDEWTIVESEADLRVGGAYRIGWKAPDGRLWYELGEYREIRRPEKLVFTCRFDFPDFDEGETLVTVEFHERGARTLLVLIHEGYQKAEHRDQHEQGWPGFLDQLAKHLAAAATSK